MGSAADLRAWLRDAPPGTLVPVGSLAPLLAESADPRADRPRVRWREQFWTLPPETRINVRELAESLGRSSSWVWKRLGATGALETIPHRLVDGSAVFVIGEVRDWIASRERGKDGSPPPQPSRPRLEMVKRMRK
ncbi:MAG: hypothetical protein ACT4P7_01180 [Gemmatimonadaceae bacterium]